MKLLDKYQDMEKVIIAIRGWTSAVDVLNKEKNDFMLYRNNLLEIDSEQQKSLDILEILVNIGFPIDEMGTYLYKDMIEEINCIINNWNISDIKELQATLYSELSNTSSDFYIELSSRLNLVPRSYNRLIRYASTQVDLSKADNNLVDEIFYGNYDPMKYPVMAVYIVNYLRKKEKEKNGYQKIK